jgi:thiamine biosynthesis lipoprotein
MRKTFLILIFFLFSGCLETDKAKHILGESMGTTYSINVLGDERVQQDAIERRLLEINALFSTWQADSEISRLNEAPVGEWLKVSDEFLQLLQTSETVYLQASGFFDPGIGRLIDLWGFGAKGGRTSTPRHDEVNAAFENSSIKYLEIGKGQVKKTRDIHVNLSAIAKGYAVDEVARLIEATGVKDFLVEVGGEVYASGTNQGDEWTVGVERPDNKAPIPIALNNASVATSGNYRNYFIWEGEKYMHIFDPKSGLPANNDLASVSVIHPRSAIADAYATAMMAMGSERAIELANELQLSVLLMVIKDDNYQLIRINLAE